MPELYVAYLGGPPLPGRLSEDHEVVLVVADDQRSASKAARLKWAGSGRGHVDSIAPVANIDGYTVHLQLEADSRPDERLAPTEISGS